METKTGFTTGEWKFNGTEIIQSGSGARIAQMLEGWPKNDIEANAHLIAAAVNACQSVNPDNPQAVAESIKDMYEVLETIMEALEKDGSKSVAVRIAYNLAKQALAQAEGK